MIGIARCSGFTFAPARLGMTPALAFLDGILSACGHFMFLFLLARTAWAAWRKQQCSRRVTLRRYRRQ
jgi:hypothetical protein